MKINLNPSNWQTGIKAAQWGDVVVFAPGAYFGKFPVKSGVTYTNDGGPERPTFEYAAGAIIWEKNGCKDVTFSALAFPALDNKIALISGEQGWHEITFVDCIINGELVINDNNNQVWNKNIRVLRCILGGVYYYRSSLDNKDRPSNIYVEYCDGFTLRESVLDFGGWHADLENASANMYNHGLYGQSINKRMVVENNLILRPAAHGAQLRAGGQFNYNLVYNHSVGMNFGYTSAPIEPTTGDAVANIFLEPLPMRDKGVNPGQGTNLLSGALWGIAAAGNAGCTWRVADNIYGKPGVDTTGLNVKHYSFEDKMKGSKTYDATLTVYNELVDVPLTLDGYAKSEGYDSADDFINAAKSRPAGTWDYKFTGSAVYDWAARELEPKPPAVDPIDAAIDLIIEKLSGLRDLIKNR